MKKYVHGYSQREMQRLREQSGILEELLHSGTEYPADSRVLEAGCGVGGQTRILAKRNPKVAFTSIDFSHESLDKAKTLIESEGLGNVAFRHADIMNLPFDDESFDHVFVCFVLEHLDDPVAALGGLKRILKKSGTITLIEGDHGSAFWHPETPESLKAWDGLVRSQKELGHDPNIGRRVHPLLKEAGFEIKEVSPRWLYADAGNPVLLDGMVNKIIVPMTQTAKEQSIGMGLIDEATWAKGLSDLEKSGNPPEGTFYYTWFKGVGVKR